ncbi:phosphotransferase [Gardnerella sp. Marseille-Q9691]|uniref:phosphotransferase n=1 Tax=Gardnerella sp. Marseille-Q9691 TaxID=3390096 RepID=UPI003970CC37
MPEVQFAGTRQSEQVNATDTAAGISHAVVQDISGKLYDVFISADNKGRKRLRDRARAAWTLEHSKDLAALGFAYDTMLTFIPGKREGEENNTAAANAENAANSANLKQTMRNMSSIISDENDDDTVLICEHLEGSARDLRLLTTDDCANVGTAIGAIHRLRPSFVTRGKYPAFTTGQIRAQLTGWIKRLRQAGHIPTEITDSWSRVLETEGLWSFETCPVHGGFVDGDILFSGSTITAVTNWQGMQINDPARDLSWIFAKLNEQRRNAVLSAYGRMMGSRLDSLIMLRANLWLQMEQVGDFIQALQRADTTSIMRFKAQVERLAHELSRISNAQAAKTHSAGSPASTITVGTLLENDNTKSRQILQNNSSANASNADSANSANGDETNERDITVEGNVSKDSDQNTKVARETAENDDTHERTVQYAVTNSSSNEEAEKAAYIADDTATQVITHVEAKSSNQNGEVANDDVAEAEVAEAEPEAEAEVADVKSAETEPEEVAEPDANTEAKADAEEVANAEETSAKEEDDKPETVIIPLHEREERAKRDAEEDINL